MNDVATNHDQLQQTIVEQEAQPNCHPLVEKIDEWEQQSMNKIRQAADNARKEVRDEDDYVETDLKEWIERIEKLNKDLLAAPTIDLGQDNNSNSLISKIFIHDVSTDFFDGTAGDIQVLENGRVTVQGQIHQNAAVRGNGEYSSGQHRLHFKIEQWNGNGEFSCGIVSKNTSVESLLYTANNSNMYGYSFNNSGSFIAYNNNNNLFYFTGRNYNNQKDVIVEFFIDCNQRIISLTNEQTRHKHRLNVNLTTCPFP